MRVLALVVWAVVAVWAASGKTVTKRIIIRNVGGGKGGRKIIIKGGDGGFLGGGMLGRLMKSQRRATGEKLTGEEREQLKLDAVQELRAMRWPNKTVPVKVDAGIPQDVRHHIYSVMTSLNALSCLTLLNATQSHAGHHILVNSFKGGCWSMVGHTGSDRGWQSLNLAPNCFTNGNRVIHHELLHALGFFHMQSRHDRDKFVKVYKERVVPQNWEANFKKKGADEGAVLWLGLPYDYNSVMHYSTNAFSLDGKTTIEVLEKYSGEIGITRVPSRGDVAGLNRLYECWDHYLGDDIPGATPYKEIHQKYFKEGKN